MAIQPILDRPEPDLHRLGHHDPVRSQAHAGPADLTGMIDLAITYTLG